MLPRSHRLRSPADFAKTYKKGVSAVGPHLVVYNYGSAADGRLGLSVSRKVGGAVLRNRVRRQISAAYAVLRREAAVGGDTIVVARPAIKGLSYQNMEIELRRLLLEAVAQSRKKNQ